MPPAVGEWWVRTWPGLLGVVVVLTVAAPAAVASYLHARTVVARHDPVMAPFLPLSVDGMLLAALVVMWVRRRRGVPVGRGPWAAFVFGIVVTIAANSAAVVEPSVEAYAVNLFPPVALAVALELVALVAGRTTRTADRTTETADRTTETADRTTETTAAALAVVEPLDEPDVDELLPAVREWIERHDGMPSQRQLRTEFGVGADRARRLMEAA
ncbi:DUF2637 domain-containing protein [Pseudonocardia broussonetiae]|nr:DUF2637 domain-containing protein [Pseudonocardia broussonetiae]